MPSLSRSVMPVALFAAGALSVVGYGYVTRNSVSVATPATQAAQVHQRAASARLFQADENAGARDVRDAVTGTLSAARAADAAPGGDKSVLVASPENVAKWIKDATGSNAANRATAIEALGSAPKADALPVLAQVLEVADDSDRPRALRSLRTLAQREGDSDDRIRSAVRKIVFHADDEAVVQSAQATLDDIERDLSQQASEKH